MSRKKLSEKWDIWIFFGLTFGITWILWVPGLLRTFFLPAIPELLVLILSIVATFVPSIMGFIFVGIESGKKGMGKLLKRAVQFRGYKWGITTILLYPLLIILVHSINYGARGVPIPFTDMLLNEAWKIPIAFLMGLVIGGPLGEEFGWRGYALPKLQEKFGGWLSALMMGAIWGLWHIPAFFIEGAPQNTLPIGAFLVTDLVFTFIIAYQQNHSKGSLVPAFLMHSLMNLTMETMPLITETGDASAWWIANAVLGIVCIFIVIFTRPKDFSGRINLQPTVVKQDPDLVPTPNGKGKKTSQL